MGQEESKVVRYDSRSHSSNVSERPSAEERVDIYWANGLFGQADRRLNEECAAKIRQQGYTVYLPQELAANAPDFSPSPEGVFRGDTEELHRSRCLVACLDQESIDSGVAAEVGFAYSLGIPIIGLYTDIRQYRRGVGRMYKNLYVIGMIEAAGLLVDSVDGVLSALPRMLDATPRDRIPTQSPSASDARRYRKFVRLLETWYRPAWNTVVGLSEWLEELRPERVLEFGCGPGTVADRLVSQFPNLEYVGYDQSRSMIDEAAAAFSGHGVSFVGDWSAVAAQGEEGFDAAILSFVLHDTRLPDTVLSEVAQLVRRPGSILIVDLTSWDLPRLVASLRSTLSSPVSLPDPRLDASLVAGWAEVLGASVEQRIASPRVTFTTAEAVQGFVSVFGIDRGADLPLGIRTDGTDASRIRRSLRRMAYPFTDRRSFLISRLDLK